MLTGAKGLGWFRGHSVEAERISKENPGCLQRRLHLLHGEEERVSGYSPIVFLSEVLVISRHQSRTCHGMQRPLEDPLCQQVWHKRNWTGGCFRGPVSLRCCSGEKIRWCQPLPQLSLHFYIPFAAIKSISACSSPVKRPSTCPWDADSVLGCTRIKLSRKITLTYMVESEQLFTVEVIKSGCSLSPLIPLSTYFTNYLQLLGASRRGQPGAGKGSSWPQLGCEFLTCNETSRPKDTECSIPSWLGDEELLKTCPEQPNQKPYKTEWTWMMNRVKTASLEIFNISPNIRLSKLSILALSTNSDWKLQNCLST